MFCITHESHHQTMLLQLCHVTYYVIIECAGNRCGVILTFDVVFVLPEFLQVGASQFQQSSGALKNKMWLENLKVMIAHFSRYNILQLYTCSDLVFLVDTFLQRCSCVSCMSIFSFLCSFMLFLMCFFVFCSRKQ